MADVQPTLKLLLFVDRRAASSDLVQAIEIKLAELETAYPASLEVVEVSSHPYLVEHYRLVVTPALVKSYPKPAQVLAGQDLASQLETWWARWQEQVHGLVEMPEQQPQEADSLRQSEEMLALKRRAHDLEQQLQFKDRIMAMLAHDLRNPLAALALAIETIEQHRAQLSPEMTTQLLAQARSQTRVMDQMITDILQGARGAATELTLQAAEFQLVELCQVVIAEFRSRIEAKELRLRVDLPSQLPTVNADLEKIRQVITNLIDNAVKYTPSQGEISVTALHRTKQKIQVTIADTGPGIPLEAQERIFSDRVRLDSDQEGYGIGLALCRQIMRAHYGRIWVESRSGEGSQFHFTLPVFRV